MPSSGRTQQRTRKPPSRSGPHRRLSSCVQDEWTPLHEAADNGHGDTCAVLLEHKGDVNARDENGDTPLKKAESRGKSEVAALLRKHGGRT